MYGFGVRGSELRVEGRTPSCTVFRDTERREKERERETSGYEPFALHAPIQWAI
jgi:hypothetical protein